MGLVDLLKKIVHAIGAAFVKVFGAKAASDFAHAAEQLLMTDFGKVVFSIVEALQGFATANGGVAANAAAFKAIGNAAVAAGFDLKDSMIKMLIELAVQKLKGTLSALTPKPEAQAAAATPATPATATPEQIDQAAADALKAATASPVAPATGG